MKNIIWAARYAGAPTAERYCRHCGAKTVFVSSGLFRINAQRKLLDVWLIFKCQNCDTTWNETVLSRVRPDALPPELLDGFTQNDTGLAMRYATDASLLRRAGAEPGIPEIEIAGASCDFSQPARITLSAEWPAPLRAAPLIRKKLGLSRSQFDRLCEDDRLACVSGQNLKKCGLSGTIVIEIS